MTPRRPPFNICHICVNEHRHIFDDIIQTIQGALVDLGHDCTVMQNTMKIGRINIVIGSTIFLQDRRNAIDDLKKRPYIAYQLEQMSAQAGLVAYNQPYYDVLEAAERIWEYSPAGMAFLGRTRLRDKTVFLPPAYHRSLEKFTPAPAGEQDIDVLFYGTVTDRRMRIVQQLRAAGVNAFALFGAYGEVLHDYLRRSKIVLNLHGSSDLVVLETVRLSFLLANQCFVVSETGEYNPYGDGVVFADYDELVETCRRWLSHGPERRREVAMRGYMNGRRIEMAAQLAREIEQLPIDRLLPEANPG